jgi:hypothetical protein
LGVLEPNGPLPPEIYWRRRMAAAGVAVVAVVVVILVIVLWPSGSGSSNVAAQSSGRSSDVVTTAAAPSSLDGGSGGSGGSAGAASGSPDSGASGSAAASASGTPAGGVATPGAVEPGAPCPDSNISVVVTADKANYAPGETPTFSATVTNAGAVACSRDIGTGQQQFIVSTLDGSKQLWSSADCTAVPGINNQVLAPGQQIGFQFKDWAGTTSAPGCRTPRLPLAPGAYTVVAKLGEKRSEPVTFNILKAPPAAAAPTG